MAAGGSNYKTSLGIAGTGLSLAVAAVVVGTLLCGGGFGGAVFERLPEIIYAKKPVPIPATSARLPDVSSPTVPVARMPDPEPAPSRWTTPVFRDPARWTEPDSMQPILPAPLPNPATVDPLGMEPLLPQPVLPDPSLFTPTVPAPVVPVLPAPVLPAPVLPVPVPVPVQPAGPMASVSLSGDAVSVYARSANQSVRLPGAVPAGSYDVVVTFAGREPFAAGSLLVLDAAPRSIVCRSSLGICKVR